MKILFNYRKSRNCFLTMCVACFFSLPATKHKYTVSGHITATNECSKDTIPAMLKIEIWVYSAHDQKLTGIHGETDTNSDFSLDAETEFGADH